MGDNEQLIQLIESKFAETNKNIESLQSKLLNDVASIHNSIDQHENRIGKIESELQNNNSEAQLSEIKLQIELLEQDRLRNNLRLTGLPPIAFEKTVDTILAIESILQLGLLPTVTNHLWLSRLEPTHSSECL